jgi:hypothetical protein
MILRNILFFITLFLSLSSVKAMEDTDEHSTLEPVTVRIWEKRHTNVGATVGGHISLQTSKHYMSFRHPSDILQVNDSAPLWAKREKKPSKFECPKDLPDGFVPSTFEIDQNIQDKKFQNFSHVELGVGFSYREKVRPPCPCDTFTLLLDAKRMDAMWETLIKDAEDASINGYQPKIARLKNVKYLKRSDQKYVESALRERDQQKTEDEPLVLYFSTATLMKGLFFQGQIYNPSIFPLEPPKYFKVYLGKMPNITSSYEDVITNNHQIRRDNLALTTVSTWVRTIFNGQELFKIHQYIESQNMHFLNLPHEHEICTIYYRQDGRSIEQKLDEIYKTYLPGLQKRYQEEQSYLSPSGWVNWLYYKEWKH